jgi:hypothetical protein
MRGDKFKVQAFVGLVSSGTVKKSCYLEFLKRGATINSEQYGLAKNER